MITNPEAKPYMVATLHRWLGCVCHGSMQHAAVSSSVGVTATSGEGSVASTDGEIATGNKEAARRD